MASRSGRRTGARKGRKVTFKYRGAKHPTGRVVGEVSGRGSKRDPMLAIRPDKASRHPGEPKLIHRRESKVHAIR